MTLAKAEDCTGCGACERACPVLRPGAPDGAPTCFAARVTDGALLRDSASGGVFSALASPVLGAGGLVFGCRWEGPPLTAVHAAAEDEAGLAALRGSKYVQSDLRDTYPYGLFAVPMEQVVERETETQGKLLEKIHTPFSDEERDHL